MSDYLGLILLGFRLWALGTILNFNSRSFSFTDPAFVRAAYFFAVLSLLSAIIQSVSLLSAMSDDSRDDEDKHLFLSFISILLYAFSFWRVADFGNPLIRDYPADPLAFSTHPKMSLNAFRFYLIVLSAAPISPFIGLEIRKILRIKPAPERTGGRRGERRDERREERRPERSDESRGTEIPPKAPEPPEKPRGIKIRKTPDPGYRPHLTDDPPFIFVSYCPADKDAVLTVFQEMEKEKLAFWYDGGDRSSERRKEVIREHIKSCLCSVIFLSDSYVAECLEELNAVMDEKKNCTFVFLQKLWGTPGRVSGSRSRQITVDEYTDEADLVKKLLRSSVFKKCRLGALPDPVRSDNKEFWICPICGTSNSIAEDRECVVCGTLSPIPAGPDKAAKTKPAGSWICPACGTYNPASAESCGVCGNPSPGRP